MENTTEHGIKVFVASDNDLLRYGLTQALGNDKAITVVGQGAQLDDAPVSARTRKAELVLLATDHGPRKAHTAVSAISASNSQTGVIVIANANDSDTPDVRRTLGAGASGYLLTNCTDTQLRDAVMTVASGELYLHPSLGVKLAVPDEERFDGLTKRELQIARYVALGFTSREIGAAMFISIRTVESHRSHIMAKLRLERRSELVMWVLKHGLMKPACDLPENHPARPMQAVAQ